jgi:hypothetical protein
MSFPQKTFELMLFAYPRGFRGVYGSQMKQLFRDCHRTSRSRGKLNKVAFWSHMILDVLRTAPVERWESFTKNDTMKNLKRDAIAFLGCAVIVAVAFWVLGYGRRHEVASILVFGYVLDAMITAGVVGNSFVFLLVKVTRLNALRIALWTMLIVHAALLLLAVVIDGRVSGGFSFINITVAYVVSFAFWFSLHWLWAKSKSDGQLALNGS